MTGHCHCGAVTITLTAKPDYLNDCNCSLCASSGAIWGYFARDQAIINGETSSYARADYSKPAVALHFCKNCGNATHWTSLMSDHPDRMGANMRLFAAADLDGVELRFPDGRNWTGETDFGYRGEPATLDIHNDVAIWN